MSQSEETLDKLQRDTFDYFLKESNSANGMVLDNTRTRSHASIAAIGFALTAYTIGVERGFITRTEAIERTLTTLGFFRDSEQSEEADANATCSSDRRGVCAKIVDDEMTEAEVAEQ